MFKIVYRKIFSVYLNHRYSQSARNIFLEHIIILCRLQNPNQYTALHNSNVISYRMLYSLTLPESSNSIILKLHPSPQNISPFIPRKVIAVRFRAHDLSSSAEGRKLLKSLFPIFDSLLTLQSLPTSPLNKRRHCFLKEGLARG